MTKKIHVGILFGGRSGEHDVSLQSAASVIDALDPAKYEIVPIGITREGHWRAGSGILQPLAEVLESGKPITPSVDPTGPKLLLLASSLPSTNSLPALDVVFPVLHGTFGEDGTVQGLLELADIPYVGAGVLASAAGMDKDVMKRLFRDADLPVVPWELILRSEWQSDPHAIRRRIEKELRYPLFVKPVNGGSSVGISKVHDRFELAAALDLAGQYDRKILVEKGIGAREIECSVLGNDHPQASVPGEVLPVNEFYDYEAKYIKEGSVLVIPAQLTPRQAEQVQDVAIRAFQAVDGAGMGRVDFLLDRKTGRVYLNEINTIPGFTSISMYPKLWEASGIPYSQLLDRLIDLALERHREKSRTRFAFSPTAHN
ncbi:MAG TPA: D-alanine--D-alanine ligase family protein [Terriglobia bacterium]|nr:D-alanine--D-alanine ligase family protein [Terriglobia bacterium]